MKTIVSGEYVRSSFFGFEDSLVSTTGVLAGMAVGTSDKAALLLSAVVVIAVQSISGSASEFISAQIDDDIEHSKHPANPYLSALVIAIAYVVAGFLPLLPYLFLPHPHAIYASVGLALVALALLGVYKGVITHKSALRASLEVIVIGGLSAAVGIIAGIVFKV
ncbi:VIT1/CCC1 transporter family protein [Candidatus Saccharibacteria bacterium]|nr:VIT1/CCC1 transporter family protein [Candidatus Saccharibacteria bacterium]